MFTEVVTIISILSVCTGESASNVQKQLPNHAISSHSFHREDVPLSFKYETVHVYTTPKSIQLGHKTLNNKYQQPERDLINFRSIQYAPLVKTEELRIQNGIPSRVPIHSPHDIIMNEHSSQFANRDHLEPRFGVTEKALPHPFAHMEYIPGHNVEVLQAVNRIPGHNAVYRSYPGSDSNNKYKKNHLLQYMIFQTPQHQTEVSSSRSTDLSTTTTPTTNPITTMHPMKLSQFYIPKSNLYEQPVILEERQPQIHKSPYAKMRTLLLNVARAYNFGVAPHKANLHFGADPTILGKSSAYMHGLMKAPGSTQLQSPPSEKRTILNPVQKSLHFAIHS